MMSSNTNTKHHEEEEDNDEAPLPPPEDDTPFFHGSIVLIKNKGLNSVITLKQLALKSAVVGESAKSGKLTLNTNSEDKWVVEMHPSKKGFSLRNSKHDGYLSMRFESVKVISHRNETTLFQAELVSDQQRDLQKSSNPELIFTSPQPLWVLRGPQGWALSMKPNLQLQGVGFVGPFEQWEITICGSEGFIK